MKNKKDFLSGKIKRFVVKLIHAAEQIQLHSQLLVQGVTPQVTVIVTFSRKRLLSLPSGWKGLLLFPREGWVYMLMPKHYKNLNQGQVQIVQNRPHEMWEFKKKVL